MMFTTGHDGHADAIEDLFCRTFSASEGEEEGRLIAAFVRDMMDRTPPDDLLVVSAWQNDTRSGCIFLSRMRYSADDRTVFILSPVAVAPDAQRSGVGQALIRYGLSLLKDNAVDVVLTYGDPAYYRRVGFHQITERVARAPLPLSHPPGWMGQSLTGTTLEALKGDATCVAALNIPALW